MKLVLLACLLLTAAAQAEDTPPANRASNNKLLLEATVVPLRANVTTLLGFDPGAGYIIVKLRATPRTLQPLVLNPEDFTLISRKDGAKSGALSALAVLGLGSVIVLGEQGLPVKHATGNDPRLVPLEGKAFPSGEASKPVEGLLYFQLDGKLKPSQLGMLYVGPAGRLVVDFK
jgi:hypothetical protein